MTINGAPEMVANTFSYGTQAPIISTQQILALVTDNYDVSRGPAWFFQVPYDKVVIVPSTGLTSTSSKKRRSSPAPGDFQRKQTAQAGDKPWFCYWNNTLLETFIYPNQSITYNGNNGSSTPSFSSASATITSSSSSSSSAPAYKQQNYDPSSSVSSTMTSSSASPTGTSIPDLTPFLPTVLKLEERRIPEGELAIVPYCVQMQILNDGSAAPVMNSTGQPVTIYINETEPTFASMSSKRSVILYDTEDSSMMAPRFIEKRQSSTSCSCEWVASGY